jgi:peptidyl-prolyl cis-trans isomerase D
MLKILRDNIKYLSWILWFVILIFIAFVFVDFGGARLGGGTHQTAATVGDQQVTLVEYQHQFQRLEDQYRQVFGERYTPDVAKQLGLPLKALEQLVSTKILLQEAQRIGLAVSDAEVRQEILDMPTFKDESGQFIGTDQYREYLSYQGYTTAQFENLVRDQVLVRKLTSILSQTLVVSDAAVETSYRDQHEKAKIRYVLLPAGRFQGKVTLTPAEIASAFEAHQDEYRLPVQRVVQYLLVDQAALRAKLEVANADIESYYREHAAEFKEEEQVRARHILVAVNDQQTDPQAQQKIAAAKARLAKGEDFAKLAGELSDDPGSKARGGELGFFGRGRMLKEFEDAAFAAPIGEVVGPIKTSFGYHLLLVEEKRAAGERPLAEVSQAIKLRLAGERATKAAEAKARELADRIRRDKLTTEAQLKPLADNQSVTFQTTPPFGRDEPVPGIGRGTPFSSTAFDSKVGEVSGAVKVPRGWAILRVAEERPARLPQLAEVEARVRMNVERERLTELARQALAAARAELAGGKSLDDIAKQLGVTAQESPEFGRTGGVPGLPGSDAVAATALGLEVGQVGGPLALPNGAVLFTVSSRQHFDATAFAQERAKTREQLEDQELNRVLGSLIAQRKRDLNVQYDRQLLEQLGLLDQGTQG